MTTEPTKVTTIADILKPWPFIPPPEPPLVQDRWFKDVTIHVDGYVVERCRFDRCTLVTEQASFGFRECFISADCSVRFLGPSQKIGQLIAHVLLIKGVDLQNVVNAALFPKYNTDGTFTLE